MPGVPELADVGGVDENAAPPAPPAARLVTRRPAPARGNPATGRGLVAVEFGGDLRGGLAPGVQPPRLFLAPAVGLEPAGIRAELPVGPRDALAAVHVHGDELYF